LWCTVCSIIVIPKCDSASHSDSSPSLLSLSLNLNLHRRGHHAGPNPVELVLAALATCQEITYRAYATALGIPLENVSVKLEGALDLRGFFAVKDGVRAGFNDVRGTVHLISSAPAADRAKLKEVVDAHCPVLDILREPVPVDLKFETERAANAA
jgi:putative redox protein